MLSGDTEKNVTRGILLEISRLAKEDIYRPKSAFEAGVLPELSEKIDGFWSDAGKFSALAQAKNFADQLLFREKTTAETNRRPAASGRKTAHPANGKDGAKSRRESA